ncbi:MAG: aspartate 1-decarboxylase [Spirochaetes bacterium GWF1_51_8]|nr:MAG: aspartate 1-decarboxylase [Spirochaetes bacterium GWF1_51_8]
MLLTILKSKIHKAVVTETDIDYVGSITIDEDLMKASGLLPYELVHVWNITNGNRLETYAIPGPAGSGVICLNGAAAHLNRAGDRVIIASFAAMTPEELKSHKPTIVIVNHDNKVEKVI